MSAITAKASRKMKKYAVLTREPRCFLGSFDFSWEQRKLSELTSMHARIGWQNLRTSEFLDSGNYMLITGTDFNDGAINFSTCHYVERERYEQDRNIQIHNGSILITKDGTLGKVAYVQGLSMPATLNAGVFNVQIKDANNVDEKYLFQYLKAPFLMDYVDKKATGGTIKHLNQSILVDFPVILPQRSEQTLIGAFFQQLDNLITLHQRKCALLFSPFQALISMMFTTSTFSWEQRKFSELVQIERGGSPRPIDDFITDAPNGLNWIKIGDAPTQGNYITKTAEKIRPEGLSKTREVHPGDLILSNSMSFGKPYIMGIDGCIHDGWLLIRNTYGVFDLTFLCHLLGTPQMLSQYRSLAAGSTVNNLNKELVGNTVVTIPSITEQRVLGDYLEQLDNLITLHQRKCISFTGRAGRLISTVNKKRITSSWEQRKFGEVFDCTVPNNTLSRAELSYDEGTVLNVHYGDVLIKYGSVLDVQKDDIPRIPHRCREDFNGALLQDGDIIIADTAEDETTGKACEISNLQGSVIVSGLHTMVCRPRNRMALGYLGYYLNSNAYHHQLLPLMQGIKVLSLSRSNIQKTSVSYPTAVKEQQHIAYYFSQLDNLITLHQRKPFLMKWRNSDANRNQTNRLVL